MVDELLAVLSNIYLIFSYIFMISIVLILKFNQTDRIDGQKNEIIC